MEQVQHLAAVAYVSQLSVILCKEHQELCYKHFCAHLQPRDDPTFTAKSLESKRQTFYHRRAGCTETAVAVHHSPKFGFLWLCVLPPKAQGLPCCHHGGSPEPQMALDAHTEQNFLTTAGRLGAFFATAWKWVKVKFKLG